MAAAQKLLPAELLKGAKTDEILADLRQFFKDKPFSISDVLDDKGNQYVDLVQEGGGVLGIALVGYVYVLEKMGIRFFSLAGTSAGSINAMLLACCGNKEDEKGDKIIGHFLNLDMFSLVDGRPGEKGNFTHFVKKTVQRFIIKKNFLKLVIEFIAHGHPITLFFYI